MGRRADRLVPLAAHHWPPDRPPHREEELGGLRRAHQLLWWGRRGARRYERQEGVGGGLLEGHLGCAGQGRWHLLLSGGASTDCPPLSLAEEQRSNSVPRRRHASMTTVPRPGRCFLSLYTLLNFHSGWPTRPASGKEARQIAPCAI